MPDEIAAHAAAVERWRAGRYSALRQPRGWLSLVGLDWLRDGDQRLGTDAGNDVVLPSGPAQAGVLRVGASVSILVPRRGAAWRHAGEPVDAPLALRDDEHEEPTILELGALRVLVIRRAGRLALRTWDTESPLLHRFRGIDHFPVDPRWRVVGRFELADPPRQIEVADVIGAVSPESSPGEVVVTLDGREHRLDALSGGESGELWLIFSDRTSGDTTYRGGRFLYTEPPAPDGSVVVDFNRAYNPPCAFSPFATCPLPPPGNRIDTAVEAGERDWRAPDRE